MSTAAEPTRSDSLMACRGMRERGEKEESEMEVVRRRKSRGESRDASRTTTDFHMGGA